MNKEQQELDEKFLKTGQAEIKLCIALERYFQLKEEEELRKRYQSYLSMRLRPGAEELIRRKENEKLMQLLEENQITASMLDSFILTAGRCQNREAQILLLRKKQEMQGFSKENWEL